MKIPQILTLIPNTHYFQCSLKFKGIKKGYLSQTANLLLTLNLIL